MAEQNGHRELERYAAFRFQVAPDLSSTTTESSDIIHLRAKGRQVIGRAYRPSGSSIWYADARAGLPDSREARVSDLESREEAIDAVIALYLETGFDGALLEYAEEEDAPQLYQIHGSALTPASSRPRVMRPPPGRQLSNAWLYAVALIVLALGALVVYVATVPGAIDTMAEPGPPP